MKRIHYWLGALLFGTAMVGMAQIARAISDSAVVRSPQVAQQVSQTEISQLFENHFEDLGVEGSVLIYDQNKGQTYQHNPERNATPFFPASTFKILNSLIALETGVIENEVEVFTWDGIERAIPVWNRDLNMRTAISISAVWFYQVLARRIGHERMQQWASAAGYGNQTIGEPEDIDTFWLEGDLRISPQEQVDFLQRLYRNELPFSDEAIALVKDIIIVEQTPRYTLRAKSGLVSQIGWYVGYLEQDDNVYFFATNIDAFDESDYKARAQLTRLSLETLGLL